MDYRALGGLLKAARINAKYKQSDVAEKMDVTFQNISSWELGKSKIDIESLIRICRLYGIDFVQTLQSVSDDEQPKNAPEDSPGSDELNEIIELVNKIPRDQWPEIKGMLKLLAYQAAEAAKQISDRMA
ncbi:MAG: helix-turn-helix transcriptional regulator [Clostridiaceae bacterium]|nr:helix-turn-helix transcriptional regulator [Clostridiaceae bacterium]